MATAEAAARPHDRHTRKRPFTGWMKRLANLKSSNSASDSSPSASGKKNQGTSEGKSKKAAAKNNPYPQSGHFSGTTGNDALSFSSPATHRSTNSFTSVSVEEGNSGQQHVPAKSTKSAAPTVATNPETVNSAGSKAETRHSTTIGGGSTFSSPNHSDRSLTTTLTTIQSTAPSHVLGVGHTQNTQPSNAPPVHFSHQFPTASPPPSAIPPHLALQPHPNSYQAATANNILTDNASILTLASSSKRRRRNSLDTNASVRALAPSSVWGGSRESLPLSVLSGNPDAIYSPQSRTGMGAFANAERASIYSSSGVTAPALSGERSSYYANKQNADGMSVRSGLLGHGRTDSITGSIGATTTSPLASPRDPLGPGRVSRRSSEWKETGEGSEVGDEGEPLAGHMSVEDEGKGKAKVVS
ncbi:hypothetical protein K505DRAFT_325396 [Melanomma pulvis-pyrius CBS 109.77]|uniref:Ca2+-modulated nonselective cation channel polycystin n=1 Tax=Melanomma pulvis-pyrius CBS 109.77 TaxID=1314802 RepID=A0A6A6XBF4_9PLEO|nr:hypothetical protein K505DRAFT_325396 [Melanomma pulvis-pyrius CBS 109.77]